MAGRQGECCPGTHKSGHRLNRPGQLGWPRTRVKRKALLQRSSAGNRWPRRPRVWKEKSLGLPGRVLPPPHFLIGLYRASMIDFSFMCRVLPPRNVVLPQKGNLVACSGPAALPTEVTAPRKDGGGGPDERGARIGWGAGRRRDCGSLVVGITLRLRLPASH